MKDQHCHSSSVLVTCPPSHAFEILADGIRQGEWAWGSMGRKEVQPGVFCGHSIFNGKKLYVRLRVDSLRLLVDYETGPSPDALQFRSMARVVPGPLLKMDSTTSVVSLITWRSATQTDLEWEELCAIHQAEMYLIRGILEDTSVNGDNGAA